MHKNYKLILFCLAFVIFNSSNARHFNKRKYYHFKRGNIKAITKPSIIKKRTAVFPVTKDSITNPTPTFNDTLKHQNKNANYVPTKKAGTTIPFQKELNSTHSISVKSEIKKEVVVSKKQMLAQHGSSSRKMKDFFIIALITIAVVAIFALIIWGLIWLANLSLIGLISAIILSIFLVLWPIAIIIDFIWGHGISGIH